MEGYKLSANNKSLKKREIQRMKMVKPPPAQQALEGWASAKRESARGEKNDRRRAHSRASHLPNAQAPVVQAKNAVSNKVLRE